MGLRTELTRPIPAWLFYLMLAASGYAALQCMQAVKIVGDATIALSERVLNLEDPALLKERQPK